jgi:hypothetical protein
MMGEDLGSGEFRLLEVTIQEQGGTFASFVRWAAAVFAPLKRFFDTTGQQYQRFNYIGEWHSHHSFALHPSPKDADTMREVIADTGALFAALLLVKLGPDQRLQCGLTVYLVGGRVGAGVAVLE